MLHTNDTTPPIKHTPEPWATSGNIIFNPKASLMKDKTDHIGGQIAAVGGLGVANDAELKANVRLIAAAPKLLQALKALASTARTFRNVPKDEQQWTSLDDDALDAAFHAIADAEGTI